MAKAVTMSHLDGSLLYDETFIKEADWVPKSGQSTNPIKAQIGEPMIFPY